jgi:hypothetical protein
MVARANDIDDIDDGDGGYGQWPLHQEGLLKPKKREVNTQKMGSLGQEEHCQGRAARIPFHRRGLVGVLDPLPQARR